MNHTHPPAKRWPVSPWLVACAAGSLLANAAWAQDMVAIERPVLRLGDSWTFRSLDGWTDQETSRSANTLVAFENNLNVSRVKNLTSGEETTASANADWQPCRSMQNDTTVICTGPLKFPIAAGYKHSFRKLPLGRGVVYADGDCEGRGMEKVKVPAGEFDAYRIECKGFWNLVVGGNASGTFQHTIWYAPAVRNQIRSVFEDRRPNGQPNNKTITELVEYKPAP
jgi:hypothetical protein